MPAASLSDPHTPLPRRERVRDALTQLKQALGEAWVKTGGEEVARFSRDVGPWARECAVVVHPATTAEVQAVVRVAAEHRVPLWTFGGGKNWGYGATVALQDGVIVMLLDRMNEISVDEESAYAVLGPGVTYKQLNDHLKAHHPSLWADCTDSTPHGSVIGNALERGVGFTAYGDHYGNLCGMEVVLPNGELVRTGGGPPNSTTWNTYKWGTGPYLEGLFTQSNLGVVTKAGMWLMPAPERLNTFVLAVRDDQDVHAVFDAVRRLALNRVLQSNVRVFNDFPFLVMLTPYPYEELQAGETRLSDDALAKLRRKYQIAPWTLTGGVYGTVPQVKAVRGVLQKELSRFGKLNFLDDNRVATIRRFTAWYRRSDGSWLARLVHKFLFDSTPVEVLEVLPKVYPNFKGIPAEFVISRCEYVKARGKLGPTENVDPVRDADGGGLIWFAPVLPLTKQHTAAIIEIGQASYKKFGFDFSVSCIMLNPRSMVALMSIFYDRGNADETARAEALHAELSAAALKAGYPEYRTSIANMSRLGADPGYQTLVNTLKATLDPDNVLAPGKYGVGGDEPRS